MSFVVFVVSTHTFTAGGVNDQNISLAGGEANLDTQFAFGLSFPTPGTYYVTAGRPPFKPDNRTTTDTNEPYVDVSELTLFLVFYLFLHPLTYL